MDWTRRGVLATSLAALATAGLPAAAERRGYVLRPASIEAHIRGVRQELLGFNGSWPGPELRARQGDDLRVRVENGLKDGALVHWHGLRVPNQMDGVNVLTQNVIPPGRSFDYRFNVSDAGTYWYHSHYVSYEQVSLGLFGPLIIDELRPPVVDQDITIQVFDMLVDANGFYDLDTGPELFQAEGRIGNLAMAICSTEAVQEGERVRLRFINPSIDRIYNIGVEGLRSRIVALDGMPLAEPRAFSKVQLAPGQRADVVGDVVEDLVIYDGGNLELGRISVTGKRAPRTDVLPTLEPNKMPAPEGQEVEAVLIMQGGVGGVPHGGFGTWALNDVSGLPEEPLLNVRRGTTVRINLQNATAFDHVMHLHGHHFWEITATGALGDYRDGTLVSAGASQEILCVLDNPGRWMLHCHMLSHQSDGMATWLVVS